MSQLLYYYPISLSAIGVAIHFFGTLGVFQVEVPRILHAIMLVVDLLVVIGLLRKSAWGFCLALLLYFQQSIMQPYWAYEAYVHGLGQFQLLVTSPLVMITIFLISDKAAIWAQAKN